MLHGGQYKKSGVLSLASSRLSGMRLRLMGFYAERGLDSFKVAKAETVSRSYEKANSPISQSSLDWTKSEMNCLTNQ